MPLKLLQQAFRFQNTPKKFPFVVAIEYPVRQVDKLGPVYKEEKVVLPGFRPLDLVPLQWHALPGIYFHDDLLAGDLVRETLKQHLPLFQLCDAVKLD